MTLLPSWSALALLAGPSLADEASPPAAAPPAAYAVVVGSNRAGPGQEPLRYAKDDAARMREVLIELGGYDPENVLFLADPDATRVLEVLDSYATRLTEHRLRDDDARFFFYYSGHAKAQGLNLGPDTLDLGTLRNRLEALNATVTLVVMDACQAGALSQVKGAAPAADFSHNAAAGLNTEGLAVLASSSATELSQESDSLGGSYFTHHLVSGLRGAADEDQDGLVTLSEAYTYAYHRTLVATSTTAVGGQHVTLETELKGRGDMVLSRPGQASARLEFPEDLVAEILIHRRGSERVVAELHKAPGSPLGLALVPGPYAALVRHDGELLQCELDLAEGSRVTFRAARCEPVPVVADVSSKGDAEIEIIDPRPKAAETAMLEIGVGWGQLGSSAYTERLDEFGFDRTGELFWSSVVMLQASGVWTPHRNLAGVLTVGNLDSDAWQRDMQGTDADFSESFRWVTWRGSLQARGTLPLLGGWLVPYLQGGGGPALAEAQYVDDEGNDRDLHWGWHVTGAAGLQLMPTVRDWRHIGIYTHIETSYAPVLENLVGDTHDSGRTALALGVRLGF